MEKWKIKYIIAYLVLVTLTSIALADTPVKEYVVEDHFRVETILHPYYIEECTERYVGGDKTGDTMSGAVIGAGIGNALGKDTEATLAGALIGGLIGHNKSNARPYYKKECKQVQKMQRSERKVYSHSTIKFTHQGKTYFESFDKGL
jgi:uncharacterized protein YcfJ